MGAEGRCAETLEGMMKVREALRDPKRVVQNNGSVKSRLIITQVVQGTLEGAVQGTLEGAVKGTKFGLQSPS